MTISDAHARVASLLERRGLCMREEVPFPPYTVDIYLPDYHACVEVDGPSHGERADRKRDLDLERVYYMPTFRLKVKDIDGLSWVIPLAAFLGRAAETKDERWEKCSLRTPWL